MKCFDNTITLWWKILNASALDMVSNFLIREEAGLFVDNLRVVNQWETQKLNNRDWEFSCACLSRTTHTTCIQKCSGSWNHTLSALCLHRPWKKMYGTSHPDLLYFGVRGCWWISVIEARFWEQVFWKECSLEGWEVFCLWFLFFCTLFARFVIGGWNLTLVSPAKIYWNWAIGQLLLHCSVDQSILKEISQFRKTITRFSFVEGMFQMFNIHYQGELDSYYLKLHPIVATSFTL